jgi:DMSO/TMAO reductase YedYZ molybdopterin-dependent catalytic subunit
MSSQRGEDDHMGMRVQPSGLMAAMVFCLCCALFLCSVTLAAAAAAVGPSPPDTASALPAPVPGVVPVCTVAAISVPVAAPIPGIAEVDPSTGLHYTGSGQPLHIDLPTYRLTVDGLVDHPLSLSYDQLRCLPKMERRTTIVCKGNFEDTAVWAGASLRHLLLLAGIQEQAKNLRLYSADGYEIFVTREEAMSEKAFLAYEWERQPVPIIHGFPVRAAFPGVSGANWVKWLVRIEAF